jgi:AcrR family transcriptional regulator
MMLLLSTDRSVGDRTLHSASMVTRSRALPDPSRSGADRDATAHPGERRAKVLGAAAALFAERGYSGTSLLDISAAAGIAKPTLYHYFASKAAILDEILSEYVESLIVLAEDPARQDLPATERLLAVMADIIGSIETHRGHVRTITEHLAHLPPARRHALAHRQDHYNVLVEDILRDGIHEGTMEVGDIRFARLGMFGMCSWTYQWYRPGARLDPHAIAQLLYDLLLAGLGDTRVGPAGATW